MKRLVLAVTLALAPNLAFAQQQTSPAEYALQINSMVTNLAQAVEQQKRVIDELNKKLADTQKQLDDAKAKAGPDAPKQN